MSGEGEGPAPGDAREALAGERRELLGRISRALERPMTVLGFVWLVLLVVDLTRGLSPFLERLNYVIWGLFAAQFLLELTLAPAKGAYLRANWLTALALVAPAVRVLAVFRYLRVLRAARGLRLLRVISSVNRGMRALGRVMGRRGLGYVAALTLLVIVVGAAGMYGFERDEAGSTIRSFGDGLWWTAMAITTMGSDYFPRSPEGRILCLLLATYGFAVFGYVTAAIASLFVARDADASEGELAGARQVETLTQEVAGLRGELRALHALIAERRG